MTLKSSSYAIGHSIKYRIAFEYLFEFNYNFSEPRCDYISPAVARRSAAACGSPVILTSSSHASHLHHKRVAAHVRACACVTVVPNDKNPPKDEFT